MLKITGLASFKKALDKFSSKVDESPVQIAKMLMIDINRNTIIGTPRDTGRLVGGWNISTSARPTFAFNKENTSNSQIRINDGKINTFDGGILWLANNVEYAEYQEFGTSKISGRFMLTKAIQSTKERALKIAKSGF